ncbi:uncharacterized protein [Ptychodera flava]|uniref:uncharacterized protein n=1 Tax=Ptychodera flava TaxID=63121 RepID=UPI00396A892D
MFTASNGTESSLSAREVIEIFSKVSNAISGLNKANVSQNESQSIATEVVHVVDMAIRAFWSSSAMTGATTDEKNQVTNQMLESGDDIGKFVLHKTQPGSGPVILDTPLLRLNLESDLAGSLSNTSITLGDGNGFVLPAADRFFPNVTMLEGPLYRIVKRFKRRSLPRDDAANAVPMNDILSLTFTDTEGNEVEVNDTNDDIQIMIASDFPSHQAHTLIESLYLEENNVTYFGVVLKVSYSHHAILIVFNPEITGSLYGNTTAYIFKDVVKYSGRYHGYQFSLDVNFSGNYSSIFIPEDYFTTTGEYYLTFTIPGRQEGNISVAIKETVCNYMDKQTTAWDSNGCKEMVCSDSRKSD